MPSTTDYDCTVQPCRKCQMLRDEAERTAYGSICEDCWVETYRGTETTYEHRVLVRDNIPLPVGFSW